MSDIENNLKKIIESRYGKDVRQAIHDGIEDCYNDGKAGAIDLTARAGVATNAENIATNTTNIASDEERIAALEARPSSAEPMTQAEYDALTDDEKNDGTVRYVYDDDNDEVLDAGDIAYDSTSSGLSATSVQSAIDEVESNLAQIRLLNYSNKIDAGATGYGSTITYTATKSGMIWGYHMSGYAGSTANISLSVSVNGTSIFGRLYASDMRNGDRLVAPGLPITEGDVVTVTADYRSTTYTAVGYVFVPFTEQ